MVFQDYAVFPHLSVFDNVAFGLVQRKVPAPRSASAWPRSWPRCNWTEQAQRMPHQLSGGQQQRVGLARALVIRPKVLLMDEPLSNLDAKLRVDLRRDIRALQQSLGITTVYVTHDQEEALSISDQVCVMHDGVVQQVGALGHLQPAGKPLRGHLRRRQQLPAAGADAQGRTLLLGQAVALPAALRRPGAVAAVRPEKVRVNQPARGRACSAMRWCARRCSPAASCSCRSTWRATARSTR
jgi:iron(III) transport system ATP-binding protein